MGAMRLTAWEATIHFGITEQAGGRIADHLGLFRARRIGHLAQAEQAAFAELAVAAADGEGHDDAVADLQVSDVGADLHHLAHGLVTDDVAGFH